MALDYALIPTLEAKNCDLKRLVLLFGGNPIDESVTMPLEFFTSEMYSISKAIQSTSSIIVGIKMRGCTS